MLEPAAPDASLPAAVSKYQPALGDEIAHRAILMLETITAGDTQREKALMRVTAYAATALAGFTDPALKEKYGSALAIIIHNWKMAELKAETKGRQK